MSRRRYITTGISLDERIADLSDAAALLWTWMIPHAEDDATITGSVRELKWTVLPSRDWSPDKIEACLAEMEELLLIVRQDDRVYFDSESFYRHQSYIPEAKRADNSALFEARRIPAQNAAEQRQSAPVSEEQRESAQNAALPSPSLSPSPSYSSSPDGDGDHVLAVDNDGADLSPFTVFWDAYPRKTHRKDAEKAYRSLSKADRVLASTGAQRIGAAVASGARKAGYVPYPARFLRSGEFAEWANGDHATEPDHEAGETYERPAWMQAVVDEEMSRP